MKRFIKFLFVAYIFLVLWITLIDRQVGERKAMLVPFWEFANVVKGVERNFYIGQIIGNITMFMPLGFMLPIIKNVHLKQVFLIGLCFSAFIELTQFITGRGLMEFDDVFNNTVGAVVGYMIFCKVRGKFYEKV